MALHKDLTGADLHEPKGVDAASSGTVYVASGTGTGTWIKLPNTSLDATSIKNLNKEQLTTQYIDIGTAGSQFLVISKACTVAKIWMILQGATATSTTTLTFRNDAGTSMGTITVVAGATAGTILSLTPAGNNVFTAGTKLQMDTDGGTSTSPNATFTFELNWN